MADFKPNDFSKENYDKVDLHRPYVDNIVLVSSKGEPMKRESDLIDVWFDSGAMPYAQVHYPFENKEEIDSKRAFPADFIAEGVDQTRGWFFTLHAIATMISDTNSYKAVISNGLVLDKNGNKMSKRLNNGVDPFQAIDKYGSDALRWYMIGNSAPWDNLKFDIAGVEEVSRKFFGTLYNTYQFFAQYANLDGLDIKAEAIAFDKRPEIDRWVLSSLNTLVKEVDTQLNDYDPTRAIRAISTFVSDGLSNWYVRLCRRRFWAGEMTEDKLSAYQTLYKCLLTVSKLIAPFAPFYADQLFRNLTNSEQGSVHLADFPKYNEEEIASDLEASMAMAQTISSLVLSLRRKVSIKVRQPLQSLIIPIVNEEQQRVIEPVVPLILNEVNVKELKFVDDSNGILVKRIKPDFKRLGPRYGKIMKLIAGELAGLEQKQISKLEKQGKLMLSIQGQEVLIEREDVEILSEDIPGWLVANEGVVTVALETELTEELIQEGLSRELINRIQNLRKQQDFEISDKIELKIEGHTEIKATLDTYSSYICTEVQAVRIEVVDNLEQGEELDFDNFKVKVQVNKI